MNGNNNSYNTDPVPTERRTLLMAFDRLREQRNRLETLLALSETLSDKFDRGAPKLKDCDKAKPKDPRQPDLIGLFMDLSEEMELLISQIGENIDRVSNLID